MEGRREAEERILDGRSMKLNEKCPACNSDEWESCGIEFCEMCDRYCCGNDGYCNFVVGGTDYHPGQFSLDGNEFFTGEELERRLKLRSFE